MERHSFSPMHPGDTRPPEPPGLAAAFYLLFVGTLILGICVVLFPEVVSLMTGKNREPIERLSLFLMELGAGAAAAFVLFWGFYELVFRTRGPLLLPTFLFSLVLVFPLWLTGYGSDIRAWRAALNALVEVPGGKTILRQPPSPLLFEWIAGWVVPVSGWTGMLALNTLAGFALASCYFLLPRSILPFQEKRLVVLGILLHPLFLLSCGTGLPAVWECGLSVLSVSLFLRGLASERRELMWTAAAGFCFGTVMGQDPLNGILFLLFGGICLSGNLPLRRRILSLLLFFLTTSSVFILWEGVGFVKYGWAGIRPGFPEFPNAGGRLASLRTFFPLPAVLLTAGSIPALSWRWKRFTGFHRGLVVVSLLSLGLGIPFFLILGDSPLDLAILVPVASILWALAAPRVLWILCLPFLLLSSSMRLELKQSETFPVTLPVSLAPGPLAEEPIRRFEDLRRSQQILLAHPKQETVFLAGNRWPQIAIFRPDWVEADGVLKHPEAPIEFRDWVPEDEFERLEEEGYRILVPADVITAYTDRLGYDPSKKGATVWTPRMRFFL